MLSEYQSDRPPRRRISGEMSCIVFGNARVKIFTRRSDVITAVGTVQNINICAGHGPSTSFETRLTALLRMRMGRGKRQSIEQMIGVLILRRREAPSRRMRRRQRVRAKRGPMTGSAPSRRMKTTRVYYPRFNSLKKSLPLSSMTMKAGKFSTSIRQIASMPSSGYSCTSTFLMQCSAKFAALPPIDAR
jgi:hypothetical protein